jgi:hypothetical protein
MQDLSQGRGNAGRTEGLSDMNTAPNYMAATSCLQSSNTTKRYVIDRNTAKVSFTLGKL